MSLRKIDPEEALNAAFSTSQLQHICRAIDAVILQSGGVVEIARAAELDRVTLYRAFRLARGPRLDTMIRVLRTLGFRLIVVPREEMANRASREWGNRATRDQRVATARRFTRAFKIGKIEPLRKVFAETVHAQQNVAKLARAMKTSRENLYRVLSQYPDPKFDTLLSFFDALELRFAVWPLPLRRRPRLSILRGDNQRRISRTCCSKGDQKRTSRSP
jgi:DNA-binding phage protein